MAISESILIVIAIIVFFIARMAWRGIKGTRYSVTSLFMRPIIYLVLTAFLIIGLLIWQDALLAVVAAAGVLIGLELGKRANIFEKDGKVLYKRSNEVTILWLVAFVIRISIDFFLNPALNSPPAFNSTANFSITSILVASSAFESSPWVFGADLLLAFSAGLLLGEAIVLYRGFNKKYKGVAASKS